MRCSRWFLAGLAAMVAFGVADSSLFAEGYGTVTGQFVLDGDPPKTAPLVSKGGTLPNGQPAKDPAVCGAMEIPDESLVVDPETKGIANVVVYLKKAPANIHPDLKKSENPTVSFDQRGCRYAPHVLVVRTDQKVLVKSSDSISHNVHTFPFRNDAINLLQAPNSPGEEFPVKSAESLPMKVACDIHPWMLAYWVVVDHPYAAVSGKDGKFTIKNLPAGSHDLTVWQEKSGYVFGAMKRTINVKVAADGTTDLGTLKVPAANFNK